MKTAMQRCAKWLGTVTVGRDRRITKLNMKYYKKH